MIQIVDFLEIIIAKLKYAANKLVFRRVEKSRTYVRHPQSMSLLYEFVVLSSGTAKPL